MSDITGLDRTDFNILSILAKDARTSNKEIAAAVGLAPSSCHERLKVLREKKVLLGAHAEIDLRALGLSIEAIFFIQLKKVGAAKLDDYLRKTAEVTEVRSVYLISGPFDMVVHVAVDSMDRLKRVISDHFHQVFVNRVETSIVFNRVEQHSLPDLGMYRSDE